MYLWSHGLMAMTADFESANLGSIPSETFLNLHLRKFILNVNSLMYTMVDRSNFAMYRAWRELENFDSKLNNNEISLNYNSRIYKINPGTKYPFHPPTIYLSNGTKLIYSPNNFPKRLWYDYNNKTNKCMCCYSLLCPDRWSAAMRIIHIIREYEEFVESLKTIQKKRIFKKINLPDDIIFYIEEFL